MSTGIDAGHQVPAHRCWALTNVGCTVPLNTPPLLIQSRFSRRRRCPPSGRRSWRRRSRLGRVLLRFGTWFARGLLRRRRLPCSLRKVSSDPPRKAGPCAREVPVEIAQLVAVATDDSQLHWFLHVWCFRGGCSLPRCPTPRSTRLRTARLGPSVLPLPLDVRLRPGVPRRIVRVAVLLCSRSLNPVGGNDFHVGVVALSAGRNSRIRSRVASSTFSIAHVDLPLRCLNQPHPHVGHHLAGAGRLVGASAPVLMHYRL